MPNDGNQRERRLAAIRLLITSERVESQETLVRLLSERGFDVTQSSVSRDLKSLPVAKVSGVYAWASVEGAPRTNLEEDLAEAIRGVRSAGPNLLVVHTPVGSASRVGSLLDRAGWPDIAGTVAGDDTLFVAVSGLRERKRVEARLESLAASREMQHA